MTEYNKYDDYWFWNNYDGKELDLIVESDVHICEIKATSTVLPKLYDGLNYFKAVSEEDDFTELWYMPETKSKREHLVRYGLGTILKSYKRA